MNRAVIMGINLALVVLCCFLAARVIAAVTGEVLGPDVAAAPPGHLRPPPVDRSWGARQIIITRNPFNASTLVKAPIPDEDEEYAKTKLRVKLLGTAAHEEPSYSWAAVEDLESRQHLVVRVGDQLQGRADVLRIERRRIILQNGPRREELALEEDGKAPTNRRATARRAPSRQPQQRAAARPTRAPRPRPARTTAPNPRVEQLAENRFALDRADVEAMATNPGALLASNQARILPKYENGQMVGLQVNAVRAGSLWQQIGVQDGDTITEFNGIQISGQQGGQELLQQLSSARAFNVTVTGRDGGVRQLQYEVR